MRPDKNVHLEAMVVWFACGRVEGGALCGERRCPNCWEGAREADIQSSIDIQCSRYLMDAGRRNSGGLGRPGDRGSSGRLTTRLVVGERGRRTRRGFRQPGGRKQARGAAKTHSRPDNVETALLLCPRGE